MIRGSTRPGGVGQWPRSARVTVYTIAIIFTVLFIVTWLGGVEYLVIRCDAAGTASDILCSSGGRGLTYVLGFGIIGAIVFPWNQFLTRTLRIKEQDDGAPAEEGTADLRPTQGWRTETAELPFGQSLVCDTVESVDARSHCVTVRELTLRFWGGHALRSGLIKSGERIIFVYQTLPVFASKYVMAYCRVGDSVVQGVGAMIHAGFLVIGAIGLATSPIVQGGYPAVTVPICVVLVGVGLVYLVLMQLAKRALNDAINGAEPN